MSVAHQITSSVDRLYVLLTANWALIKVSLQLLLNKQNSSIFILFNQQWFVSLWTDMQAEEDEQHQIPYRYKEELCMALVEASLLLYHQIQSSPDRHDNELINAWLLSSIEVAEICSKVFDWKVRQSQLGESVCQTYLLFLEDLCVIID